MEKELKTLFLDVEKGIFKINGEEIKKVTAFTLIFKKREIQSCGIER